MSSPEKDPNVYLRHMLELSQKALSLIEGIESADYSKNEALKLALIRLVQTIGEAARNVPYETQEKFPRIPWREIIGMRHKLVHNYMGVDEKIIWLTVQNKLPELLELLENILGSDD